MHEALVNGVGDRVDHVAFEFPVNLRHVLAKAQAEGLIERAAAEFVLARPDEEDLVAGLLELHRDGLRVVGHDADAGDDRGGRYGPTGG